MYEKNTRRKNTHFMLKNLKRKTLIIRKSVLHFFNLFFAEENWQIISTSSLESVMILHLETSKGYVFICL